MYIIKLTDISCPKCWHLKNIISKLYSVQTDSGNPPTFGCITCEGRFGYEDGILKYFKQADEGFKSRTPQIPWK
ncbi:hypothetical protein AAV96_00895 [Acinetobacter sp. AG1]|uniref:hypothetical protein n=1 Tax=Acinetobacter TaxID=469 RepID=UPI0006295CC2|nr:hypothetical protein [Acinetobacter sp. AG1]KKW82282.1 hypothetical protein AAV96_00895 [Acinetobacter sp. AG1]